jgi:hypothetical protein
VSKRSNKYGARASLPASGFSLAPAQAGAFVLVNLKLRNETGVSKIREHNMQRGKVVAWPCFMFHLETGRQKP